MDKYAKAYDVCAHHCANGVANATCDASIPGSNPTAHWVDFFFYLVQVAVPLRTQWQTTERYYCLVVTERHQTLESTATSIKTCNICNNVCPKHEVTAASIRTCNIFNDVCPEL